MARKGSIFIERSPKEKREQIARLKERELERRRNERVQKYLTFEEDIEDDQVAAVEKALRAAAYLLRFSALGEGIDSMGCLCFSRILTDAAQKVSWIAAHPERHFHNATFE